MLPYSPTFVRHATRPIALATWVGLGIASLSAHEPVLQPALLFLVGAESAASAPVHQVRIRVEGEHRFIESNGWPDHAPGTFPRPGNPNLPTPQSHRFRVPVKPRIADTPAHRPGGWWGVALNGVPFEPGTGETWNNDPRSGWRYEAATGFLNLGLDEHNAHVQPTGAYHYHALPTGLVELLGGDRERMRLIAWAADGFPVYTGRAHAEASQPASPLRGMKSSYRLKKGPRPVQPGGPAGDYDGRFTQDFEYVPVLGDLDEWNGRTGVTPEFPEGTYYYCITKGFPFVPRGWRGIPDDSFAKAGPPGGGGLGPRPAPLGGPPRGIMEGGAGPAAHPGGVGESDGSRPGPGGSPLVRKLDADQDGVISAEEMDRAPSALRTLDANGNGRLEPEEFRPSGRPGEPPPRR